MGKKELRQYSDHAMEWAGVRFPARSAIFLFATGSRPVLGPTQPPTQWVPGALSLGLKRPGREADHSPPTSAGINAWSCTSTEVLR
jgi:hypothetical protein